MRKFTSLMLMLLCAVTTWGAATDLPTLTTDTENPVWYLIKNVRKSKYATYAGDAATMTQQATASSASFFYFTGSITDGVATVKIHNYEAGDKLCAAYNSWTVDGIDWYIQVQGTTGLSISNNADFSGNGTSWNDARGEGEVIEFWNGSDEGSIWAVEHVTDFTSVIDVDAAKTAAKAEITNLTTVSDVYTIATTDYETRIDAVTAASTGLSDLNAAIEEINSIVAEYKTASYKALSGKYFSIKTPARANGYLEMSTSKVIGVSTSTSPADIWQFVENDGKINIFNPYTKKYLCEPAGSSAEIAVTTEQSDAGAYDLVVNASAENEDAKIKLTSNGKSAHMAGGSTLVRWDDGGASEYTVLEMSETDINNIAETYKTTAATTLDEWATLSEAFDAELIAAAKTAIDAISTTGITAMTDIDSQLENVIPTKKFTFQTTATDTGRNGVWVSASTSAGRAIGADTQDYNAIWSLRYAGGTSFFMYNELNSVYMGAPSGRCTLTTAPAAAYTLEIIDAENNIIEMHTNGETLHASNWTSSDDYPDALINWDENQAASRWYINTIDVVADIQDILDGLTEDDYADVPALGQYPTAAYNALVEARNTAITVGDVVDAIAAFNASKNIPVFTINGVINYANGKSIYDDNDGTLNFKTTNVYDKTMWWAFDQTTTEVGVIDAVKVTNFATQNNFWGAESLRITETSDADENDGIFLFYTAGNNTPVHYQDANSVIVRWGATTTDSGSAHTFTYIGNSYDLAKLDVDALDALAALQAAYNAKAYYADMEEGTGIGQYVDVDEAAIAAAVTPAAEILNKTLVEQAATPIDDITAMTEALNDLVAPTMNMPVQGKYYRIKGAVAAELAGYYISGNTNTDGGRIACVADGTTASTIYFYNDGKLLAYENGHYIALNKTVWTFGNEEAASAITFGASTHVAGAYSIKSADKILHYTVYNGAVEVNRCDEYDADTNHDWALEEVTELPVAVSAAEIATFYTPVALTIPAGVECYYINTIEQGYVKLAAIEGVVPANTGIVIKATEGTHNFTIGGEAATIEDNKLAGTSAATDITPADNTAYYVLAKGTEGVGLYKDELSGGIFHNNANKAYLPVVVESGADEAPSYSFNFDWAGTTGIEGVAAEGAQDGVIYDITGRRVKAITAPGIYIVNGRKVVK